jgi:hypothetical protein
MKLEQINYTLTNLHRPQPELRRLYLILKATLCPEINYRYFLRFYLASKPHCMQITFLQHNGVDVGFFTCTYSTQLLMEKERTICRVAIGLLEAYQGGKMPFAALCLRIIQYKLKNPFSSLFMVAYLANPLVYASIARYTAEFWPRHKVDTPEFIVKLKDEILEAGNMKKYEQGPFVLKIHFHVHFPPALFKRMLESRDSNVKYYFEINPNPQEQMGVMTIVPVRWMNIVANIWKAMIIRPAKKLKRKLIGMMSRITI